MSDNPKVQSKADRPRKRRWINYALYVLLFVFLLFFLLSFLIQIPKVQNFVADKAAASWSKKLGSKVEVDGVHFSLIDGVIIEGLYIEDEVGDTLIYSKYFSTSFGSGFKSVLDKDISFNRIYLEGGKVNLITRTGDSISNLEKLLKKLNNDSETDESGEPLMMSFDGLNLDDIAVQIVNENSESRQEYAIKTGIIDVETIDIANGIFDIKRLYLEKPFIRIQSGTPTNGDNYNTDTAESEIQGNQGEKNFYIDDLVIKNGFIEKTLNREPGVDISFFNKDRFKIEKLNIELIDSQLSTAGTVNTSLKRFSGILNESFAVDEVKCDSLSILDKAIEMTNFGIVANNTSISQQFYLSFNQFSDLRDSISNVYIDAIIENVDFALQDLVYFVPALNDVAFIRQNINNGLKIKGKLNGNVENLNALDVQLKVGKHTLFEGAASAKNLNRKGKERIHLTITTLETTASDLESIIPGLDLPENFNKLGNISFKGLVDGFLSDLVLYGSMNTNLGSVVTDVRLDSKNGIDNLAYSGQLDLKKFDLGTWSDNPDFKFVDLTAIVSEGKGLVLNNANAKLVTNINSFWYKDYEYQNIQFNGILDKNTVNGDLAIKDENIDLSFDGVISDLDSLPTYNFKSNINYVDLHALNLTNDRMQVSGDINLDMKGKDFKTMVGTGQFERLLLVKNDSVYSIDSIFLTSKSLGGENMLFNIDSEVLELEARGIFDLAKIPQTFLQILKKNYPYHTRSMELSSDFVDKEYDYDLTANIKDTKNLLELASIQNLRLEKTRIKSFLNSSQELFDLEIVTPSISFNDLSFKNIILKSFNKNDEGSFVLTIDSSQVQSMRFNPMRLESKSKGDIIDFKIITEQEIDSLQNISISGQLLPKEDIPGHDNNGYEINIEKNELFMLDKQWMINPKNKIVFSNNFIDLENLMISDSYRAIVLDDVDNEGLSVDLYRFDLDLLNPIIDYDKMLFTGEGNININVNTLFGDEQFFTGLADVPDFRVNNDQFGDLLLKVQKRNDVNALDIQFAIAKDSQNVLITGDYDLESKQVDMNVDMDDYPLSIFEYIIPDGISNTKGVVDIDAKIFGDLADLQLEGDAYVQDAGVKVDYLGAYYTVDDQWIKLDQKFIDATGVELVDEKGNVATIIGGLKHRFFADPDMDINISADRFIGLNTTKVDNPLYYGLGEGKMSVDFSGPFSEADIYVDAVTSPNARLSFPISDAVYDFDESFIQFKTEIDSTDGEELEFKEKYQLLGLNFEMNLEITEEASVKIIFDERVGEILEGNGNGNVSLTITRSGVFEVFGDYNITGGEYLFSAYGLIAKPFRIKEGGSLRWTGDPFDASLDVEAIYTGVRAPLNVFISEYLNAGSQQLEQEARNRTDVNLELVLGGTLYKPDVNFDIEFPQITGELRSYVDSKMRTLRATENGINNQVVGLLVFKNFLPYDNPLANISGQNSLVTFSNNVTEFFTSQLGLVVNDLIAQGLSDESFIKGIDVNIGLNENTNIFDTQTGDDANFIPDELDINTRYYFKNDDFVLNVGGNYVWEPTYGVESYVVGDVILDYFITEDRKLKLQIYSRFDYDETEGFGRQYKNGFGITYRNEFGSISDFVETLDDSIEENKTDQSIIFQND